MGYESNQTKLGMSFGPAAAIEADSVTVAEAQRYFDSLLNDKTIPHTASQWCGKRCEVMQGKLMQQGAPLKAMGTAFIQAPPGAGPEEQMHVEPPPGAERFSFAAALARAAPGRDRIVYDGFEFVRNAESSGLLINHADGSRVAAPNPNWRATLSDAGGTVSTYGNHIVPTLNVRDETGNVTPMVFDPSLARGPITVAAWHALLGGPAAIALTADWQGRSRPVPTTPESARRLAGILDVGREDAGGKDLAQAIDAVMAHEPARREMFSRAFGPPFGKDPDFQLPYLEKGGRPATGAALAERIAADVDILKPYVAFIAWRDRNYPSAALSPPAGPEKPEDKPKTPAPRRPGR